MALHNAHEGLHLLLELFCHQPQCAKLTKSLVEFRVLLQLPQGIHLSLAFESAGTVFPRKDIVSQQGAAVVRAQQHSQFGHIYELVMHASAVVKVYGEVDPAGMVEEDHQNVCVRGPHYAGLVSPLDSLVEVQDDTAVLVCPQGMDLRSLDL